MSVGLPGLMQENYIGMEIGKPTEQGGKTYPLNMVLVGCHSPTAGFYTNEEFTSQWINISKPSHRLYQYTPKTTTPTLPSVITTLRRSLRAAHFAKTPILSSIDAASLILRNGQSGTGCPKSLHKGS